MKQTNSSLLHAQIVFLSRLCLQHERRDAIVWNKYENLLQKHPDERGCGHIVSWDMPSTVEIFINLWRGQMSGVSIEYSRGPKPQQTICSEAFEPLEGAITIYLTTHVHRTSHREVLRVWVFLFLSFFLFPFFFVFVLSCFVFIESSEFNLWLHTPAPQKIHAKKQLLKYWHRFLCSLQTSCGCFTYLLAAWVFYGYRADLKS